MNEKSWKDVLSQFQGLLIYEGNLHLHNKIVGFLNAAKPRLIEDVEIIQEAKPFAMELLSMSFLNTVFGIMVQVHAFSDKPLNVAQYLIYKVNQYDNSIKRLFIVLMKEIINDTKRFGSNVPNLSYLRNFIESELAARTHSEYQGEGSISYFTGKDSMPLTEKFVASFFSVRGLLLTDEEHAKRVIIENSNPVFHKVYSELYPTLFMLSENISLSKLSAEQLNDLRSIFINDEAIEKYLCYEARIKETYLEGTKWKHGSITILCGLLRILNERQYFKKRINRKNFTPNMAIDVFSKRFNKNLKANFKKLDNRKFPELHFIDYMD